MRRATLAGPALVASAAVASTGATLLSEPVPGATVFARLSSTGTLSRGTVVQPAIAAVIASARKIRLIIQLPPESSFLERAPVRLADVAALAREARLDLAVE